MYNKILNLQILETESKSDSETQRDVIVTCSKIVPQLESVMVSCI